MLYSLSMKQPIVFMGILGTVAVVLLLVVSAFFYTQYQPVSAESQSEIRFVVPRGQAVSTIANRLAEAGLIRNPFVFRLELKRLGLESQMQAGSFELSPSMTMAEIALAMTTGSEDIWITIPEGWRREEVAQSLTEHELEAFNEAEFLALSAGSEGRLFPDTYLVPREATAETIFNLLTNTFEQKVAVGLGDEIAKSPRDFDEVLVMASLLEREAVGREQMRQVAGVLWKRIDLGMPLQVDATLQYAKGYNAIEQSWWVPPLAVDRQLDSLFNTYQNPGLPPRPISNPGLDAIEAALDPADNSYLFYIHDRQGDIHFAETLDQHNANVNRYLR